MRRAQSLLFSGRLAKLPNYPSLLTLVGEAEAGHWLYLHKGLFCGANSLGESADAGSFFLGRHFLTAKLFLSLSVSLPGGLSIKPDPGLLMHSKLTTA